MGELWSPQDLNNSKFYDNDQWNSHRLFNTPDDAAIFMGSLDTAFMVSYSVGLFISGALGDRFNLRKVLAFGMISSAITVIFFGCVSEWLHIYNYSWYLVFWCLTGLLQSTGWPTVVAIIGYWFGKSSRGLIMGIWGASPSVGNIIGSYSSSFFLPYGYEYSFLVPAAVILAGGIVVYFGLISTPQEAGLPEVEEESNDNSPLIGSSQSSLNGTVNESDSTKPKAINFCKAVMIPGVIAYSLCYACLKFVNYSFFFWLPFYLQDKYGWSESKSDFLSTFYDGGGIIGSIVGGLVSDYIGFRSPVVGILLFAGCPSLLGYYFSPKNQIANAALMGLTGFFINGAANLISTAIAADLGRQKDLSGNSEALATVTGIIDGTGSAGAAIGQLLIPLLKSKNTKNNWLLIFILFIAMTFLTLLCIAGIIWKDIKLMLEGRGYRRQHRPSVSQLQRAVSYS
ncbi:SLC37A3 [Cordylochernes scorpioides]|uniref:Sugar phosphate exchanger 3 n=1 Tax=Cordylochernes scorpioides TaxID=51811 RepID=A0ABY6K392_9ARAC|nr:SLC37A3 [Cordylochernes scorpioides]